MAATKPFTIGEVARRAGLRSSAIRYYEAAGVLPEPTRVSGWRRYSATIFSHLAAIELAQEAGFSLAEIRTLLHGSSQRMTPSARWTALAQKKLPEVAALVARAREMQRLLVRGIECGCERLQDCPLLGERAREVSSGRKVAPLTPSDAASRQVVRPIARKKSRH